MANKITSQLTDDDLILQMQTGDNRALHFLIIRYKNIAYRVVNEYLKMFPKDGISVDEYISVAITSVVTASKKYVPGKNNFYSYWKAVSMRAFADYAKKNSYLLGGRSFNGVSFENQMSEDNKLSLHDIVGENDNIAKCNLLNESTIDFLTKNKKVTKLDLKIVSMLKQGYELNEISLKFNISMRNIYYRVKKMEKLVIEFINR